MMTRWMAMGICALLAACGGGGDGGEDAVVIDDPDKVGAGWITIDSPQPPAYSTDYGAVVLSGQAFISPTWWRCCSGSATDTGVTVTWSNASTGASGAATQRLSYLCLFSSCVPGTHTWWTWIELAVGDNLITVTAADPAGNLGRAHIKVTRGPDTVAPTVTWTTPADGATGVATNSPLQIAFSEPMAPMTLHPLTVLLQEEAGGSVSGTVSYADSIATFTPAAALSASTRYTAVVTTGAMDQAGNALATAYAWSFTTGTAPDLVAPTVTSTWPASGATCVPTETSVSAGFSEPILGQSLTASTFLLKDASNEPVGNTGPGLDYTGTAYLRPIDPLANSATYTATLTTGVTDLAGNPLVSNHSWTFTTQHAGSGLWDTTSMTGAPSAREDHTAVWTGSRMIVWGGGYGDGASYDPADDAWSPISGTGAPESRSGHVAVWTGSRMIVWGGVRPGAYLNSGALYDPASDSWTAMSTTGAPSPRAGATAVWTGSEMIVWGGDGGVAGGTLGDGARYDPSTDTWSPISASGAPSPRSGHTAVWSGSEMIVWGGLGLGKPLGDGARFDPSTDTWSPVSASGAPGPRSLHTAVWTGEEVLLWGGWSGSESLRSGGRFRPASNSWQSISEQCAPMARYGHVGVWTGTEMLVWGGPYVAGGRYRPATDAWGAIPMIGAPSPRMGHTGVWDGNRLILWGGDDMLGTNLGSGARYQPQ